MVKQAGRGTGRAVGSNQFQERFATSQAPSDERHPSAATHVPAQSRGIGRPSTVQPLGARVVEHRRALAAHLDFALHVPKEMSDAQAQDQLLAGADAVSRAEDSILGAHPDLYGVALIEANKTLARYDSDVAFQMAVDRGEGPQAKSHAAALALLEDAASPTLDLARISQAIADIEGGGEWLAQATGADPEYLGSEDFMFSVELASLSVMLSRSSGQEERAALTSQMSSHRNQLVALRLQGLKEG